eukprot:Phypoly_transcript_01726.p1 GENE.Phypoly_transcript_01726~~Phypoly_transcript_01726.p1  ORF type:complete len:978 (+),score=124.21 Phypoly_transcript_01726:128-3061(+)
MLSGRLSSLPSADAVYFENVTNQEILLRQLKQLFPVAQTHVNSRKKSNIKFSTGTYLELDIWIPEHQLAFEFQDAYHYVTTWYSQRSQDEVYEVDSTKKLLIQNRGISLVVVPCWWNGEADSLAATIHFERPDLHPQCNNVHLIPPISVNPPPEYFPLKAIPDVGELMLASFPGDPLAFSPQSNTWWLGEKYDGIRCCWNPIKARFYSRGAQELPISPGLVKSPSVFMDSECWFGRGLYSSTYLLLSNSDDVAQWPALRIITFDVPPIGRQNMPFEERYKQLMWRTDPDTPAIVIAPRILGRNSEQLDFVLQSIIDDGGEGAILRKVGSFFEHGRSTSLIKLKSSFGDKEAIVVAITSDRTVHLKLPNGVTFSVPPESVQVPTPSVGEVVTFTYEIHSRRDVPVNPKISRVRTDLAWDDVVMNSPSDIKLPGVQAPAFTSQPQGHWTKANMRKLLEKFARKNGLDPLRADTWYRTPENVLRRFKGARAILRKFKGYYKALTRLFPEIKFDGSSFPRFPRSIWQTIRNRRHFFERYAKENDFDPLHAENWNKQPRERIMAQKGAVTVMKYHNQSVPKALHDLFPNIGIDLRRAAPSLWKDVDNRRKFFEAYAEKSGFDPRIPTNWYNHPEEKIIATKGASEVIYYHHDSISKALRDLFPRIGLEKSKFLSFSKKVSPSTPDPILETTLVESPATEIPIPDHEKSVAPPANLVQSDASSEMPATDQKRRKFFERYAKEKGFDSLNPVNWYSQSRAKILSFKGGFRVLAYYNDSVSKALVYLFPDIGLDPSKFADYSNRNNTENRKRFFELYAKENGFNPLVAHNWYLQTREKIMSSKGAHSVVYHHNNSVSQALIDLFPDIGLDKMKFWAKSATNRRSFFEKFAQANGFSPLNPEAWYNASITSIMSSQEASSVIYYHKNSLSLALRDLFPNIGLLKSKLWHLGIILLPRSHYEGPFKKLGSAGLEEERMKKRKKSRTL